VGGVKDNYQVSVKYQTLHKQLYYHMKAKLKAPIPVSNKKNEVVALEFEKN
jgi:putative transposase